MKSHTHLRKETTLWIVASASPLHLAMVEKANGPQAGETCAKAFTRIKHQTTVRREMYIIGKNNILANAPLMYILYIFGCFRISFISLGTILRVFGAHFL